MSGPVRTVMALLPLAAYFFTLGVWQSGKRPRVVAGPADFGLLAFGLGGLIAFGPVGQLAVRALFPRPSLPAWLAVASLVGLLAMIAAIRARKRLVVYNVEAADLDRALALAMGDAAESATRTVRGFEDLAGRRGVSIEVSPRLRVAVIEAHGERTEALILALDASLRARLRGVEVRPTRLATVWFALAGLVILAIPVATGLLARREVQAAIRRIVGA